MKDILDKSIYYTILIFASFVFTLLLVNYFYPILNIEYFENTLVQWDRNKCDSKMGETMNSVLTNEHITQDPKGDLKLPCSYNDEQKEINEMITKLNSKNKLFIIDGCDEISAKDSLYKNVLQYHGPETTNKLLPRTYLLPSDINKLQSEFGNKIYILKKNIQRQEGLFITNKLNEIIDKSKNDSYVIAQELLQDPFIINGRKTNMRFYILVKCVNDTINVYVFNDGFMYYTKDNFKTGSLDFGPNITTGYIDRSVYDTNPLTLNDLKIHLQSSSSIVFSRIYDLIRQVFLSFTGKICINKTIKNNVKFQLFGADIALNNKLYPQLIEINKGPDMSSKDDRDGAVKYKCIKDMLQIIGVLPVQTDNGFIQVI